MSALHRPPFSGPYVCTRMYTSRISPQGSLCTYYSLILANLLLQETIERIHVGKEYGDIHRGIYLVRGENIVLLGEIVSFGKFFKAEK